MVTAKLNGFLNIPDYIRDYGPLQLYWEGGCLGEGIIKYIKPCITQGTYRQTFVQNALQWYYKEKFFQTINNIDDVDDDDSTNKETARYNKFRTYKDVKNWMNYWLSSHMVIQYQLLF